MPDVVDSHCNHVPDWRQESVGWVNDVIKWRRGKMRDEERGGERGRVRRGRER